jgi:hypothetical protein
MEEIIDPNIDNPGTGNSSTDTRVNPNFAQDPYKINPATEQPYDKVEDEEDRTPPPGVESGFNNIGQLEVPQNVIDGNLIRGALSYNNSKSNPEVIVKSIYSGFINSIKKDVEVKKKTIELTKKKYEDRIKYIKKSRLSEEEKVKALNILTISLNNEIKIINNQIENLIQLTKDKIKIYSAKENAKKYFRKKLIPLDDYLSLSKATNIILKAHNETKRNNFGLILSDKKYIIASLLSTTSIVLTKINIKNYNIDNTISEIEDEINKIYNGEVTNPEQSLIYLKRKINIVVTEINIRKRFLSTIQTIIDIINVIIDIMNGVIFSVKATFRTSSLIPLNLYAIPDGLNKIVIFSQNILEYSSMFLVVIQQVINSLLDDIRYQENRLNAIFLLFETSISTSIKPIELKTPIELNSLGRLFSTLTPNQFDKFLNGGTTYSLGYLYGFDYKGFKFYLKEEYNLNFVVRGYKRRYAVATNLSGREIIQSDYSFTLEPEVLVDQIKVEIDLKNLSA